jgi:hypothetical protein
VDWGTIEATDEVAAWFRSLDTETKSRVTHDLDLLAELGPILAGTTTRQLRGKLREVRSGRDRITYYLAKGQRAILLTHFFKTQRRETAEIDRAERAMHRHVEADR